MTPKTAVPGSGMDSDPVFPDGVQDTITVCMLAQLSEHEHCSTTMLGALCPSEERWAGEASVIPGSA
jgi:hypothetical protein